MGRRVDGGEGVDRWKVRGMKGRGDGWMDGQTDGKKGGGWMVG